MSQFKKDSDDNDAPVTRFRPQVNIKNHTFEEMRFDEQLSARMTKASYINLTEGSHASNAYATKHIPGWKIDERFTSEHISVFVEKATGNVQVAFRGTQTNADWHTNKAFLTMREEKSSQLNQMKKELIEIHSEFGDRIKVFSGHSKGGAQAIYLSEWMAKTFRDINHLITHTQDPFIPTRRLLGDSAKLQHFISRTATDAVSIGANLVTERTGYNQTIVEAEAGTSVLQSHDLNVKTGVDYTGRGTTVFN